MKRLALLLALTVTACVLDEASEEDIAEVESEAATGGPTVTELFDGQPIVISGATATIRHFKIEVPAGFDHVVLYRSGPLSVGADVYVKRGALPSAVSYDCRRLNGAHGTCTVNYPAAGTYYVMVQGVGNYGYTNMSLTADYQNTYSWIGNNTSLSLWNQYGYDQFFKLAVPANVGSVSFTYTLDPNDDGALDLVVKRGAFATATTYDCIKWIDWEHWLITGTCTFTNPPAGTFYVGLLGHGAKVVGTFTARYRFALVPTDPPISTL